MSRELDATEELQLSHCAMMYLHGMQVMAPHWMYDLLPDRVEELRKKFGPDKSQIPPIKRDPPFKPFILIPSHLEDKARLAGFIPPLP